MDFSSMTNMLPSLCRTHTPPPGVENEAETSVMERSHAGVGKAHRI